MSESKHTLESPIKVEYMRDIGNRSDVITTSLPIINDGKFEFITAHFQADKYNGAPTIFIVNDIVHKINESLKVVQEEYLVHLANEE